MPVHLTANFPYYYGNGIKWGQSGYTKKFVGLFQFTFYDILWQNILPKVPNGAQKSAFPYFSVSMATFSDFGDFSFVACPRAIFIPNIKSLSVTTARQSRELRIWWKRAIYKLYALIYMYTGSPWYTIMVLILVGPMKGAVLTPDTAYFSHSKPDITWDSFREPNPTEVTITHA